MALLTKSKYLVGLSCPRYLWMMFHDLDKLPENDLATEYIIQQGKQVGEFAKELFPDGVQLQDNLKDFKLNIEQTKQFIKKRKILFEAGIIKDDIYARADILFPVKKDEWDIIEVKGSTKVKEKQVHDLSFQKYVYEQSGLKIRKCFVLHINNDYVKNGNIDPKKFFIQDDVTDEVIEAVIGIQKRIDDMLKIIEYKDPPKVNLGNGCNNGIDCPCEDCWNFLPEGHVFELYYGGKKSLELFEAEVHHMKDIPDTKNMCN